MTPRNTPGLLKLTNLIYQLYIDVHRNSYILRTSSETHVFNILVVQSESEKLSAPRAIGRLK